MIDYIQNGIQNPIYAMSHKTQIEAQLQGLGANVDEQHQIFTLIVDLAYCYNKYDEERDRAGKAFGEAMANLPKPWGRNI